MSVKINPGVQTQTLKGSKLVNGKWYRTNQYGWNHYFFYKILGSLIGLNGTNEKVDQVLDNKSFCTWTFTECPPDFSVTFTQD